MLSKKIEDALNEQINTELFSSYQYLSMAAYFRSVHLEGFAHWVRVQSSEEYEHAMKIFEYIDERDGRVVLQELRKPPSTWDSTLAAVECAFQHEQELTQTISELVNLANSEKDYATNAFLQWFVSEQVEEEAVTRQVLNQLQLVGDAAPPLFFLDQKLGLRTTTEES